MDQYLRRQLIKGYARNAHRYAGDYYDQRFDDYFQKLYDSGSFPTADEVNKELTKLIEESIKDRIFEQLGKEFPLKPEIVEKLKTVPLSVLKEKILNET